MKSLLNQYSLKISHNKAFVFILISTALIWFVLQLSKPYTKNIEIDYQLQELPKDFRLENENKIKASISTNGLKLLEFSILKPKLILSYTDFSLTDSTLVLSDRSLATLMSSQFGFSADVVNVKDDLTLTYYRQFSKEVFIYPKLSLDFQPGYDTIGKLKFSPKTIEVFGKKNQLSDLKSIPTKSINLNNLDASITGEVELDTANLGVESYNRLKVKYAIEVERFTEKQIQVPIQVINLPERSSISIYPKQLILTVEVPVSKYDELSKDNFRVVCDFAKLNTGAKFMVPKLIESPEYVKYPKLQTQRINFLIKE